jgi:hypothetical protein
MRRFVGAAFAFALIGTGPALAVGEFTQDGWSGEAVFQNGKFRQCNMWAAAINNWDIGLALEQTGELRLGLRNARIDQFWQMVFNAKTALRIQIDDGPVLTKAFTSVTPHIISTTLNGTDWDKRLLGGNLFRVNVGNKVRLFHLTGIKEAMGKLRACVAKHQDA